MKLTVKVFPTLRKYLDEEPADKAEFTLFLEDLPGEPKRISGLIAFLNLPADKIGQIILNGHIKWDHNLELRADDRVVLQTHIGGG